MSIDENKRKLDKNELEKVTGAGDTCTCANCAGNGRGDSSLLCWCGILGNGVVAGNTKCTCQFSGFGEYYNEWAH